MNKNDLAVILGGRVATNDKGEEAIIGLDERMLEIFDELLDNMRPDYIPSDEEMEVRISDLLDSDGLDIEAGQYEGETFYIVQDWDTVAAINREYQRRYNDNKDALRRLDNWGFADEYAKCDYNGGECGNVIRTSPDSYGWQPQFWDSPADGRICLDCTEKHDLWKDYLEEKMNRNALVNQDLVNPGAYGWEALDFDFEIGFHQGQNDDPKAVIKLLYDKNGIDVLFTANIRQFDVDWTVWVKEDFVEEATSVLENANTKLSYDPGTELGKVLRGEPSDVYTMRTYTLTPEEFVKGEKIKEIMEGKYDQ